MTLESWQLMVGLELQSDHDLHKLHPLDRYVNCGMGPQSEARFL